MSQLNTLTVQPLNVNPIEATTPWANASENYRFISTQRVIELATNAGFEVQKTTIARTRRADKIGFQKHRIDLVPKQFANVASNGLGDSVPRLTLVNGHDSSTALTFTLGFFRLVCENGLIMGSAIGANAFKTYHSGQKDLERTVIERIVAALDAIPKLIETQQAMRSHQVHAIELQYLTSTIAEYLQKISQQANVSQLDLLQVKRQVDVGSDLWSVINRIQENATRGGYRFVSTTGNLRRAAKINAIDKDVKVNQFIMDRAMEVLTGRAA